MRRDRHIVKMFETETDKDVHETEPRWVMEVRDWSEAETRHVLRYIYISQDVSWLHHCFIHTDIQKYHFFGGRLTWNHTLWSIFYWGWGVRSSSQTLPDQHHWYHLSVWVWRSRPHYCYWCSWIQCLTAECAITAIGWVVGATLQIHIFADVNNRHYVCLHLVTGHLCYCQLPYRVTMSLEIALQYSVERGWRRRVLCFSMSWTLSLQTEAAVETPVELWTGWPLYFICRPCLLYCYVPLLSC